MDSFLDAVYRNFQNQNLNHYCFVFPTRRAAFVFREKFIKQSQGTVLLPEIVAIRDWITRLSPLPVANDYELLLLLYSVISKSEKGMTLDKFFSWGKILLNDFNELDQNLVDAEKVYSLSWEERKIDAAFSFSDEEIEEMTGLSKLFGNSRLTSLQEQFMTNWKAMPLLYKAFKQLLTENQLTYEGLAYKAIAELAEANELNHNWEKIVFAGFYALSLSEQKIIASLEQQQKAEVLWDVDTYYYNNPNHEAGLYLRRSKLKEGFKWKNSFYETVPKNIYITGAAMQTAQVKWLCALLSNKLKDTAFNPETAVVVLPDESLLQTLLSSLPPELKDLNITMGYPVKQTGIYAILKKWIQLHAEAKSEKKYLLPVTLLKQFLDLFDPAGKQFNEIKNLIAHTTASHIDAEKFEELNSLLAPPASIDIMQAALRFLVNHHVKSEAPDGNNQSDLNEYILNFVREQFSSLKKFEHQLDRLSLLHILKELLTSLKIPFYGEPLKGMQVMGFLETRVLDFEYVFILSVNENILPASVAGNTYIPYSIRKLFKLPLRVEQDAVYAYHFYRLLQRASEVHLIYNTEAKSFSGGEMSRYILQITNELTDKKYPVSLHFGQVHTPVTIAANKPIVVQKDQAVLDKLTTLYINKETAKGFSATALADYIACTLRYYLKHVAFIRKKEEEEDVMSAKDFGNIFHKAISTLYSNDLLLTDAVINSLQQKVEPYLATAINSEYGKDVSSGNNYLLKEVLCDLLNRTLVYDKKNSPIQLLELESAYEHWLQLDNTSEVKLYGKIDRIDRKDDVTRIIDYKTGNDEVSPKIIMEQLFADSKKKAMFQLLFYTFLYKANHPNEPLKAGIYKLKSTANPLNWLHEGNLVSDAVFNEFGNHLTQLISTIFNPDIAFTQADDLAECKYCDFINICNRN